jgi:hypothetical protein
LLLLKAGAAEHRPALSWLEGYRRICTTQRTIGPGLWAHPGAPTDTLGLALLTMLGIVFELFVVEEKLLACSKYEFCTAIATFQNSVRKLHGRLPKEGKPLKSAMSLVTCRSRFPVFFR